MSNISDFKLIEPLTFHREYDNDLGKTNSTSRFDQCSRVAKTALPFITLYKPLAKPVSVILGSFRIISCVSFLMEAIKKEKKADIKYALLQTVISITSLASEIFAHPAGMLITTGQDLIINATQLVKALKKKDYAKALKISTHILNNSLHLALFFTGGLEILAASLSVQILLGLYESSNDFKDGNYLEGCAHLLMAGIRTQQLKTHIGAIKMKWEIQSMLEKIELNTNEEKRPIDANVQIKKEITTSASFDTVQERLTNIIIKYGNNPDGIPMLQYAILVKDIPAVDLLLEQGASPFTRDWRQQNCLYYAVKSGELKLVKQFVDLGVSVNDCCDSPNPLETAIRGHNHDIAKYLMDIGAKIDQAFTTCCQWGNFEILKHLICRGHNISSEINERSDNLLNLLMTIPENNINEEIKKGKLDCTKFLENLGIISPSKIVNKDNILYSVSQICPENLEYLLDRGYISANQFNSQNTVHILTPASWNTIGYGAELVKILISKGADVKSKEQESNRGLLHSIFGASKWHDNQYFDEFKTIVKLYLENGLDINQKDTEGLTPLGKIKKYDWGVSKKIIDVMISLGATA